MPNYTSNDLYTLNRYISLLIKWYNKQVEINNGKFLCCHCPYHNNSSYPKINHLIGPDDVFLLSYDNINDIAIFETSYADGLYFEMSGSLDGINMTPYACANKKYTCLYGTGDELV